MSTEKERDTHVYMAKLAEQAERYDGMVYVYVYVVDWYKNEWIIDD